MSRFNKSDFSDAGNLILNAFKIGAVKNHFLSVKKNAIHYCKRDVNVLASCFKKFCEMFISHFQQDVYNHISMPGFAFAILNNEGCYDCYSISGPCLQFSRAAIVGGRVMTRDNVPHHTKHEIVNFDAVALNLSAMARLEGFAKSTSKIHHFTIPKRDYHISKVNITSLSKSLHFPLQSAKEKDASRDFTNAIVGRELIMDQYALEDLEKFQGATYEVIEGLYWDQGLNNNIVGKIE